MSCTCWADAICSSPSGRASARLARSGALGVAGDEQARGLELVELEREEVARQTACRLVGHQRHIHEDSLGLVEGAVAREVSRFSVGGLQQGLPSGDVVLDAQRRGVSLAPPCEFLQTQDSQTRSVLVERGHEFGVLRAHVWRRGNAGVTARESLARQCPGEKKDAAGCHDELIHCIGG